MKRRVYLETTIVSYLTARPTGDLVQAARQHIAFEWWESRRGDFELYVSQYVLDEAGEGDPDAARRRLALVKDLPILTTNELAVELGEFLVRRRLVPRKAATDALHIALATVHKMDILLTWNCRHLANGEMLGPLSRAIRSKGYEPPVICTPDELLGE